MFKVNGPIVMCLIKVLLPSGGGVIACQVLIWDGIWNYCSALAASVYYLYICITSLMKEEPILMTMSLISIIILLKNTFLTKLLSISTRALNMDLGLSLGSLEVNCLYLIGVITTGFGILYGSSWSNWKNCNFA